MDYVKKMRSMVNVWRSKYPKIIISGNNLKEECNPSELIHTIDFTFNKFFFQYDFEEGKEIVFVELKNGIESGTSYLLNDNFDIYFWYDWSNYFDISVDAGLKKNMKDFDSCIDSMKKVHDRMLCSMEFIMTSERDYEERLSTEKTKELNDIKGIKRKKKKSPPIYMLSDIIKYVHDKGLHKEYNKNEINCPCWRVRGHYRHYKSGKTVFIKSYLKGKKRNSENPKAKEYYV